MTDQTAGMQLPAASAGEWSLSSRDKKRLKRILAISAAILLLLWLLFQLAQFTLALGTPSQTQVHIDGDWTRTVHAEPIQTLSFSVSKLDEEKEIAGEPPRTPLIARGPQGVGDGGGSDQINSAEPLIGGETNIFSAPGPGETNPGAGDPTFPRYGNIPPPPWAGPGGGFLPGGGGASGPSDNGKGDDGHQDGSGPIDDPVSPPNFDVLPPLDFSDLPGGDSGNPTDIPPGGSIPPPDDTGTSNVPPVVQVPEPNSVFLFGAGLLALLGALRIKPRRRLRQMIVGTALLAFIAGQACAETATVYGTTATIFSKNYGAFQPANTDLVCFSMNEANCWDGKKWHHLYPMGRRHYAIAKDERVACSVIVAPSNDCWTGAVWYRLPRGQVFGVIGGFFSNTPGAFITEPLRWKPAPHASPAFQSPLGEFASKR